MPVAVISALLILVGLAPPQPAGAVHDGGIFELDGNIADGAIAGDDWATLFPADTSSTEFDRFFAADGGANELATYFQGSSQDREDVSSWRHGGASGPQDKDDITNAYAAAYFGATGDTIVYAGADRFAQNGDSELGFWFFQDEISLNANGTFSGVHTTGDVLVLAVWQSNGGVSGIEVFEWDTTATNNLRLVSAPTTSTCPDPTAVPVTINVCARGNTVAIPSPWPYTPKFGPSNIIPPGGFFEAGINLTALVGARCFTSFLAETRSSHATATATLQDFVLGDFDTCVAPTILTQSTPQGEQARGATATNVSDTATFTAPAGSGAVTGTADFFLCGPGLATATTATGCPTGGTQYGNDKPITTVGTARQATSDTIASLTATGVYCWRVEYSPPVPSNRFVASSHTDAVNECFELRPKLAPRLTTDSSPAGSQDPGVTGTATDTAHLEGDDGAATGTVDFFLCGPTEITETGCPDGGDSAGTGKIIDGDGDAVSDESDELTDPGTYCWRAEYSGDDTYLPAVHTDAIRECFTLRESTDLANATIATLSSPTGTHTSAVTASDTAHLEGDAGPVTGSVDFWLCGPGDSSSTNGCPGGGIQHGTGQIDENGDAVSDTTPLLTESGLYCWRAEYSGDDTYNSAHHTDAENECFELLIPVTPVLATTSSPTGNTGTGAVSATDTATVTAPSAGPVPTGTVEFFLCAPSQLTGGQCPSGGTSAGSVALASGSATSAAVTASAVGTHCWRAEYSGDATYAAASHTNAASECFTIERTRTSTSTNSLRVVKTTTGGDGTFSFVVDCDGTRFDTTLTISTSDGTGDASLHDIPDGTSCTVTERASSGWTASGSTRQTVVLNGDETVQFRNSRSVVDLNIVKTDAVDPVSLGDDVVYTLVIRNVSTTDATGVTITDQLPDGVVFVSASPDCTHASGVVTCDVGSLLAGASAERTITVTPQNVGTIENVATVNSTEDDANPADNRDDEETVVAEVLGIAVARPAQVEPPPELPRTGWDIARISALALLLVALGTATLLVRRVGRRLAH